MPYLLTPRFTITDPKAILKPALRGKYLARRNAYMMFEGMLVQLVSVDLFIHLNP